MKLPIIVYCFTITGICYAQSSPNDTGIWLPPSDSKTSVYHGVEGVTNSDVGMGDMPITIFKDEIGREPSFNGYLRDRPPTPQITKQAFPDVPPAERGGIDQGYVGPFNTPSNNPKGVYLGIDVPLFGK